MKIEVLKLNNLTKKQIIQIVKLKNSYWKRGLLNQKIWFNKKIMPNDLHILLFDKEKSLIGYNLLRVRKFFIDNEIKKKPCLYFDTLIIKKAFRGLKLSLKILIKTHEISKKKKLPMMLICKKKLIKFYEKQGWFLLGNSNIKFLDHKFNTFAMIYCSKTDFKKKFLNKTINILIDK